MELYKTELLHKRQKQPRFSVVDSLFLLIILILGFVLRSYRIGSLSLWIDEFVTTYKLYLAPSFNEFLSIFNAYHSDQIPLSHLIYYSIFHLFSIPLTNIEILRWVSVFIGVLNLILFFIFVKFSLDLRTALFATFLFAISPFHILFSQMIRPYIFYEFAGLCSLVSTILLYKNLTYSRGCVWVFANTFLFISHYTGVLLILIELFFLSLHFVNRKKSLFLLFPVFLVVVIVCIFLLFTPNSIPIYTKEDDFVMGIPSVYKWLTDLLADDAILTNEPFFHQGQTCSVISPYWLTEIINLHLWFDTLLIIFSLFSITYVLFNLYSRWKNVSDKKGHALSPYLFPLWLITSQPIISFLLTVVIAPVLILTFLSFFIWPCMQTRYTLYSSFAMYPLIAYTLMNIEHSKIRRILLVWIIIAFSYQTFVSLLSQKTTDFKTAGKIISQQRKPDEPILTWGIFYIATPITNEMLAYYSGISTENIIPVYSCSDTMNCVKRLLIDKQKQRVWLVIERYVFHFPDDNVIETYFHKAGLTFEKTFLPGMNGLWLYHLSKRPDSFTEMEEIPEYVDYRPFIEVLKKVNAPDNILEKAHHTLRNYIDFYHPPTPMIWNYIAWSALDRNEPELAEWFARCAIYLQPQTPWGYHSLTISQMEQNREQEAINTMQQCFERDPTGIHKKHYQPLIRAIYIDKDTNLATQLIKEIEKIGGFVNPIYKRRAGMVNILNE
ncbi:MAG TPA: hypothetical protein PLT82_02845 [Candidatus Hydrogenedens sp.]|nr:hypothetical protein [Candidatus Hydrogenedens sp.]HOL19398.1 hypothetical protein [Candidatus Hydrogenedens sp.]HPP58050.1 hypothetical protein [Candidatus Hydrogenedens sp.]